jgi:hypothetical protein
MQIQRDALPTRLTLTFDRGAPIANNVEVSDLWRGDLVTLRRVVPVYLRALCEELVRFYETELDKAIEEDHLDANPLERVALTLHEAGKRKEGGT